MVSHALESLIPYGTYMRQAMVYRDSQLVTTFRIGEKYRLPVNVMMHVATNMSSVEHRDGIDMDSFGFLTGVNTTRYVKHCTDFKLLGNEYRSLFPSRIGRADLNQSLLLWNKEHKSDMKFVSRFDEVVSRQSSVLVYNYNPLFRMRVTSDNPIHRLRHFETLFGTMLQQIGRYERNHIIAMPIPGDVQVSRQHAMTAISAGKITRNVIPTATTYFEYVLFHLALLLYDNTSDLSIFRKLPYNVLRLTSILFIRGDQSISANLATLMSIADSSSKVTRFLDTIANLSKTVVTPDPVTGGEKPGSVTPTQTTNKVESTEPIIATSEYTSKYTPGVTLSKAISVAPVSTDDLAKEFITNASISEDQKIRISEHVATKYKKIKLSDGKTIEEVLTGDVNQALVPWKADVLAGKVIDESYLKATTEVFDKQYLSAQFRKDVISSIMAFQANGLFVSDLTEVVEVNEFTRVNHMSVSFEDIGGKKHTVKFKYPIPDKDGYMLVNGVKLAMTKQMVNVPIAKISPTRVSLISNYNKTLVDRVSTGANSLLGSISKHASKLNITVTSVDQSFIGIEVPYEYRQLGLRYGEIKTSSATLVFDYARRFEILNLSEKELSPIEARYGVCIGKLSRKSQHLFMNHRNKITTFNLKTGVTGDTFLRLPELIGDEYVVPPEWCVLKILDKDIPVVFVLAYRFGLTKVLEYLKVVYRFIPSGGKKVKTSSEVAISFRDGTLIFSRYPLVSSLILSGLSTYSTLKLYTIDTMDDSNIYYQLMMDKGMSINYLRGIDNHFTFFIDPITRDVLEGMGEPTNTRDLLIRAVEMLVYETDVATSSMQNFRVRSYEKIPATIYNEISRQYANYVNSDFKESSFSINTESVFQRVVQDQTVTLKEEINPIHAIKEQNRVTYTGFGGRSSTSFVERDRQYPADGVGILSEATVDSGSVALNAFLTPNANIKDVRGMFDTSGERNDANSLSTISQLLPFATNDDAKRANFSSIQLSHHVPSEKAELSRVRSGYETTVAQRTSSSFVLRASHDGKVTEVDNDSGLIKVVYRDGTSEVFEAGDIIGSAAGSYYNHHLKIQENIQVGAVVKEGTALAYHTGFFSVDSLISEPVWNTGVTATIAVVVKEVVLEDSCALSSDFAKKLMFQSIYARSVRIQGNMSITSSVKIGDAVEYGDVLLRIGYDSVTGLNVDDSDVDEMFEDLNSAEYRAKREGVIADIQVYYTSDEMSDSVKLFIRKTNRRKRKLAKYSVGTESEHQHTLVSKVPVDTRIQGISMNELDVLIIFYIKSDVGMVAADKACIANQLKTVVGDVIEYPVTTESGIVIDCLFGTTSVFNRIVLSAFKSGILARIVERAEVDIVSIYF